MDATVTIKFFRVAKPTPEAPNFETILASLHEQDVADREATLDEGIILRLERYEAEATYRVGEFCRVQRTNIPPSAGADGLTPTVLAHGKGLGHLAAFRYHVPTRILLLQINQNCATPSRISLYLSVAENKPLYVLQPVLRTDVLTRIKKSEVRAFTFKFAEPQNLEALDDPALSGVEGARQAAAALRGHEVEITISAGASKKRHLHQLGSKRLLSKLSKMDSVKTLKASISEEDKTKWLDLLEEQMKYSEILDLPSDNPNNNYQIRKRYLTRTFHANIDELKKLFGPKDGAD